MFHCITHIFIIGTETNEKRNSSHSCKIHFRFVIHFMIKLAWYHILKRIRICEQLIRYVHTSFISLLWAMTVAIPNTDWLNLLHCKKMEAELVLSTAQDMQRNEMKTCSLRLLTIIIQHNSIFEIFVLYMWSVLDYICFFSFPLLGSRGGIWLVSEIGMVCNL